ncbi:MAG: lipid-binding SYLF domain-containing protein [Paludisphaera borealis]|uniref:lipid-binding SYLF domain-containing protein n=1 Tax=Paludisphaera borealis TaxID=1387353 RepID=UPI0028517D09|nr:lipid-binding SYLF domain-containing protein [Paludisphaera borealis]MDR3623362.1 lipid-binding SYLF domain-containing protein [Paludisphaera borealis]
MRTSTWRRAAAFCAVLGLAPLGTASAQKPPDVSVSRSIDVLSEVTRNPKTGMPRLVMRNAQGIVIVPDMFKASFVIGARFGRGVLLVKQPDGTWSNPVFVHLMGGSFGFQAGAQSTDLVLVFQTQRGLDRFVKGKGKLTLGVDVGAAAGPVGRRFEAGTDVALKSEILSYSNTQGIFAGVSAEGGTLQIDWKANMRYYGRPVSAGEILAVNSSLPVPEPVIALQQMLAEKTALPAGVVVGARPPRSRGATVIEPGGTVIEGEEIEIDGAIPAPVVSSSRPRSSTRRPATAQPKTRVVRPDDDFYDDLEPIPDPAPRRSSAPQTKPRTANDEDLPTAIPDLKPKVESKPQAKPAPALPADVDDAIPDLDAPRR